MYFFRPYDQNGAKAGYCCAGKCEWNKSDGFVRAVFYSVLPLQEPLPVILGQSPFEVCKLTFEYVVQFVHFVDARYSLIIILNCALALARMEAEPFSLILRASAISL